MTFTTQKQIWEHLIANEGKPCLITKSDKLVGLKDGLIYNFTVNEKQDLYFYTPSDWQPYTEPEPCWLEQRVPPHLVGSFGEHLATELAHEAIKRIECLSTCSMETREMRHECVGILKNLIGDKE